MVPADRHQAWRGKEEEFRREHEDSESAGTAAERRRGRASPWRHERLLDRLGRISGERRSGQTLRDCPRFTEQAEGAQTTILIVIGAVFKSIAFEGARSGDFTETYDASIGGESKQTITIILLAERPGGAEDDLLLQVDSLDIV